MRRGPSNHCGEWTWIQSNEARSNRRLSPSTTPSASQMAATVSRAASLRTISPRLPSMANILSRLELWPCLGRNPGAYSYCCRTDVALIEEGSPGMIRLYAATDSAVAIVENGHVELALEDGGARCLAVDPESPDTVYVGTSDEGLFKSEDGGKSWERLSGVTHPRVTSVAVSPVDGALYAGTEPSSLFVSRDGRTSWQELEGLKNLPSAPTWSFPPRPWTSHVRSIALSFEDPDLIVAGIELGGVVRSEDFGESWAAADTGLEHRYVWALAADRDDPALIYVSAAAGPGQAHGSGFSDAAIYRRSSAGRWEAVADRLAEFPYALVADPETPGALYAGFGDGRILYSANAGTSWDEAARVPGLDALTVVQA